MNLPCDTIDFGPVVLMYTFKPGIKLPEVGDIIENDKCMMVVTESNKEQHYIKILLTTTETVSARMQRYMDELEEAVEDLAELLYNRTSSGMTALIGWDSLPEDEKETFIDLTKEVLSVLNKKELLILKYEE